MNIIYILIAIIAALQLADAILTVRILNQGGREHNPVLRWVFERVGTIPTLAVVKLVFIAILVAVVPYLPVWAYAAVAAVYIAIVAYNFIQYRRMT